MFSFGVPFLLIGLMVLWLDHRGITDRRRPATGRLQTRRPPRQPWNCCRNIHPDDLNPVARGNGWCAGSADGVMCGGAFALSVGQPS
ncbi:hypothetical protein AB0M45_26930 [Nocardia sp. NPDC051787]|uniref:hypothetical protein n=1 Tax=Nocardia sp. NPDC051787 TaxID=3155415 RepID=UPI0034251B78